MKRNDRVARTIAILMVAAFAPLAYAAVAGPGTSAGLPLGLIGAAFLGSAITLLIEHRREIR